MRHRTTPRQAAAAGWVDLDDEWEITVIPLVDRRYVLDQGGSVLARLTYADALTAAKRYGGQLPTPAQLKAKARLPGAIVLTPFLGTPTAETSLHHSRLHDADVDRQMREKGWTGLEPVAGAGKHWVDPDDDEETGPDEDADRDDYSHLFGWDKDGDGPGEEQWQPRMAAHKGRGHHDDGTTTEVVRRKGKKFDVPESEPTDPYPETPPPPSSDPVGSPPYITNLGERGRTVAAMQQWLLDNGFEDPQSGPLKVDADHGPKTHRALMAYLVARGEPESVPPPLDTDPTPVSLPEISFRQAKNFRRGRHTPVQWLIVHTAEMLEDLVGEDTNAEALQSYCATTTRNASWHYCLAPGTRILTSDFQWLPIEALFRGDELVGVDEHLKDRDDRCYRKVKVTDLVSREAECLEVALCDGRVVRCTPDHRWLVRPPAATSKWKWRYTRNLEPGYWIRSAVRPWTELSSRDAGYMEGLLDGEGTWHSDGYISFSQKPGPVLDRACGILDEWGIPYTKHHRADSGVSVVAMTTAQGTMELLGRAHPVRLMAKKDGMFGRCLRSRTRPTRVQIDEIRPLGVQRVWSLETDEHTFLAEGLVSHNSVDSDSITQSVQEKDTAWHAGRGGVNDKSIGIEHSGYASQTPAGWADDYSQDMLRLSAKLAADICRRHEIPIRRLSIDQLQNDEKGICGHGDIRDAFHRTTHWDPGDSFPWKQYLTLIREAM